MRFASRQDAGRQLGQHLREQGVEVDLVLGLPRGGVVVAAEVARVERPLDVLIVRKIGHPWHREFAVGALAEPDVVILDEASLAEIPVARRQLDAVIAEETARLQSNSAISHAGTPVLDGKTVLLVDDGLATGATAEAAVLSAKQQTRAAHHCRGAGGFDQRGRTADAAWPTMSWRLMHGPGIWAVGQYYEEFSQTSDEEVLALLSPCRRKRRTEPA